MSEVLPSGAAPSVPVTAAASPPNPSSDVVVLDHVSRVYRGKSSGTSVSALNDLSLRIPRGSLTAIRGASGSGKSTLLNLLGGLDLPDAGKVEIDGVDLTRLSQTGLVEYRSRKVGFVFQTFNLLPLLTALENVEFALGTRSLTWSERRGRALELLAAVGMDARADHRPGQLSGGEQQRVGIARALANSPPLVLADEPTGNLDEASREVIVSLLVELSRSRGATVVVVTHDAWVSDHCDVVHTIRFGRIDETYRPTGSATRAAGGPVLPVGTSASAPPPAPAPRSSDPSSPSAPAAPGGTCRTCGKPLAGEAKFCASCGAPAS